ncbi:MAG: L,D-transpeptidase family protein [Hyphomicrobiaceae bacterium]
MISLDCFNSVGLRAAWALIVCTFASLSIAIGASPAHAQASWAGQQIGSPVYGGEGGDREPPPERKPEPLNDLRPDATPWRSDVMLKAMAAAIESYQRIVDQGGWPLVPQGRMMRAGDEDPRVPILRKRLRISGDMPPKGQYYNSETFDSELEDGVKRFQTRNGIRPTGRIERSVYAVLNMTAQERLDQLKLNYERLRALTQGGVEDRYVLVNVPAFQLEAVEKYEVQLRHRVIVGRVGRDTPEVRATIKALNFFPYWRVPDSVATLDLVPRLKTEPQYLSEEVIRVYDGYNGPELNPMTIDWNSPQVANYKFKQDPGDKNALGLVRIDMQNEFGVYMHDTPMKKLFGQRSRSFSAGCVRVQEVFQLAEWIAKYEPGWEQPGRVQQVLAQGQPLDLTLTRPIPVYFTYITAWAEPSTGRIEFRPDIYGRDHPASTNTAAWVDPDEERPPAAAANALAP